MLTVRNDIVSIANSKFGAHVLVKAVSVKELEVGLRLSPLVFTIGDMEKVNSRAVSSTLLSLMASSSPCKPAHARSGDL